MFLAGLAFMALEKLRGFDRSTANTVFDDQNKLPGALGVAAREASRVPHDYTGFHNPYGGNPTAQKQLGDAEWILNTPYQQSYQKNIRNVQIETEQHRLPEAQLMNVRNNYQQFLMPEGDFQNIQEYWKRRHRVYA